MPKWSRRWPAKPILGGFESHRCLHFLNAVMLSFKTSIDLSTPCSNNLSNTVTDPQAHSREDAFSARLCKPERKNIRVVGPLRNDSADRDEVAVAASTECTRSGALALLLSSALFTMVPYWQHRAEQVALVKYVALRLSLAGATETLDGSVNWQTYKSSNPSAESETIAHLLKVKVTGKPVGTTTTAPARAEASAPGVPNPPTGVKVSIASGIDEMPVIADLLVRLDDSNLLTKSRQVSIFYNYSIFRWAIKRRNLLVPRLGATSGGVLWEGVPDPNAPANFVPSYGSELLLNNLTVRDVRALASFELPLVSDTTSIGLSGEREIEITPGSLPRTLYLGTLCAEGFLLFLIIYFGAFTREAASGESFPVRGTLFGAFAGSTATRVVFAFALFVPALSSWTVLWLSRRWPFAVSAGLITLSVFAIFHVLQRKRYFGNFSVSTKFRRRLR